MTILTDIRDLPFSPKHGNRIGLFGGSFNPPHQGHNHAATVAMNRLGLNEVWWLVSPQNPLKDKSNSLSLARRMTQTRDVARHPAFRVSDMEARLGTTYSIEIIRILKTRFPNMRFVWIVGADNFIQLPKWRSWAEIMELVPVAVIVRPGHQLRAGLGQAAIRYHNFRLPAHQAASICDYEAPVWTLIPAQLNQESSTQLRRQKTAGPA